MERTTQNHKPIETLEVKEMRQILSVFKQTSIDYVNNNPECKDFYTDVWKYKDVKIITKHGTNFKKRKVYKGDKLIHIIGKCYELSPITLALMLKPLIKEYCNEEGLYETD